MLKLIVNADDLGLTPGCTDGIIKGLTKGIVTDTSLMVNTPFTDEAVSKLKENGIERVGLHLNVSWGRPLLPAGEVPSLVDENGFFRRKVAQAAYGMRLDEVRRELAVQAERFMATGLGLTHLDSHHHAHSFSPITEAALELAKQFGVPLRQTNDGLRETIRRQGLVTTDAIELDFYEQGVNLEHLKQILIEHPEGTLEIMCHPAETDELLYDISSYNSWRDKELAILTSREMRSFIEEQGIQLISFDGLSG